MGRFGDVAVIATRLAAAGDSEPPHAWNEAAERVFPSSASLWANACPRAAFLGLCESGAVRGVRAGAYTTSVKNKAYALRALQALRQDPTLIDDRDALWARATDGVAVQHNEQMDVVRSLWREDLLR